MEILPIVRKCDSKQKNHEDMDRNQDARQQSLPDADRRDFVVVGKAIRTSLRRRSESSRHEDVQLCMLQSDEEACSVITIFKDQAFDLLLS